jgi:guanylate kinase
MRETSGQDRIIVFTGPDGSGRKSVAEAVGLTFGMTQAISCTTRAPRRGEINGLEYHFISRDAYADMQSRGEFIESVEIDGQSYGIRKMDVEDALEAGGSVYLILNREGADRIKEGYGDQVVRVFLFAGRSAVEERQRALGLEEDVIARRMSGYDGEMAYRNVCEHAFENLDLADTVNRVTDMLEGQFERGLVDKD